MARVTGIEITDQAVRICEIDGSPRKHRILGAVNVPFGAAGTEEERLNELCQALKAGLKAVRPKREQVILGLPAREAVIREIVVPFKERDQIRKVIKFESESHLPVTNVEDVVVSFYKIEETGPRSRLLIAAVPKPVIRWHMRALSRAGIEPTQIDLAPAGIFNYSVLDREFLPDPDDENLIQVILDLGDRTSHILVSQGNRLRMMRAMHIGSESLTRGLTKELGIRREEAETMTHELLRPDLPFATEAGEAPGEASKTASNALANNTGALVTVEANFARRLVNEIRRTLSSIQMEGRVNRLWLCGVGSTAPSLERELATAMGVEVRHLIPLSSADHNLPSEAGLYMGAPLGLALKGLDHDTLGLEFRQEEFRFARKFDRIRNPLMVAATLVLILFMFLAILDINRVNNRKEEVEFLARQAQAQFQDLIVRNSRQFRYMGFADADQPEQRLRNVSSRPPLSQVQDLRRATEDILNHIRVEYGVDPYTGAADTLDKIAVSALTRLNQWFTVMKEAVPQLGWMQVTALDFSNDSIRWTMRIPINQENALDLLDRGFSRLEGYSKFNAGTQRPEGNDLVYTDARLEFVPER